LQVRDKARVLQARDERAGVVKLVDALDSKSRVIQRSPKARIFQQIAGFYLSIAIH
jgi:hypothetical protein